MKAANTPQKENAATSAAGELKKFKDLLDSGVITQEKFDAKKKQLLPDLSPHDLRHSCATLSPKAQTSRAYKRF